MYLSDQRALAQSKLTSTHLITSTATATITSHTLRVPPQKQCCVPPSDVLRLPLVLRPEGTPLGGSGDPSEADPLS